MAAVVDVDAASVTVAAVVADAASVTVVVAVVDEASATVVAVVVAVVVLAQGRSLSPRVER